MKQVPLSTDCCAPLHSANYMLSGSLVFTSGIAGKNYNGTLLTQTLLTLLSVKTLITQSDTHVPCTEFVIIINPANTIKPCGPTDFV